ncbi:MAG TPA: SsgA family sporulation/cell division regulator [Candidatus Saccharimonadales bacterium]|nr:SsgA family sporulation/cell division regulator [Candidatus Saccharimonadales bacterium]
MAKVKQARAMLPAKFRDGVPLSVELFVNSDDPFRIVHAIFRMPNGGTEWELSFELIETVLKDHHAGVGDVRLALEVDEVSITLESHEGQADILISLKGLQEFHTAVKRLPRPRKAMDNLIESAIRLCGEG